MNGLDCAEYRVLAQLEAFYPSGDFMGEHVQQHFGVRVGVDVAQIMTEHVGLQLFGVGEVAVVGQYDAERRVHIERLCLGQAGGRTGGGVTHMRNAGVAHQRAHVSGAENVAHHAAALVHMKGLATGGNDTGGILTAMLQYLQAVIQQLVDGGLPYHA